MYHRRPFDCLCFQRSAGVLGRLSLVRKNTSKTFKKTLHFIRTPIFYLSCSSYTLYHPFKRTFVRGIQSALTVTYFHDDWRLDWTGRHCTSLDWTVFGYAWLPSTPPHCSTLDWKGKYHTVQQFTALHRTDLHRTALRVSRRTVPEMGLSWTQWRNFPSSQIKMPAFLLYPFLRSRDNFNSNTIPYYVKLLQAEDNPLRLAFNPLFRNLTYLQAFDSPHSGCSACCHYPF